jgi:molybdopterin synthase catalytic subunit
MRTAVAVGEAPLDPAALLAPLEGAGGGGVASFTGIVRGEGGLAALRLEHYPGVTERMLGELAEEAGRRWPLLAVSIAHRVGEMAPGERIVFVGAASRHRAAALAACAFLIDRLKTRAPFWKHERFADGTARWVEARAEDEAADAGWN